MVKVLVGQALVEVALVDQVLAVAEVLATRTPAAVLIIHHMPRNRPLTVRPRVMVVGAISKAGRLQAPLLESLHRTVKITAHQHQVVV